jgi:hypothetical protein
MTIGPRLTGNESARLLPERRVLLRRLVASVGLHGAARSLGIGVVTLERAVDPYALLSKTNDPPTRDGDRVCAYPRLLAYMREHEDDLLRPERGLAVTEGAT